MTTTIHDTTDYTQLSVLSQNINGLSENKKRKKIFNILINKKNLKPQK